jgi:hypothetical protein
MSSSILRLSLLKTMLYLGPHLLHVEHKGVERLLDVGLLLRILLPPALQPRLQLHLELRLRRSAAPINLLTPEPSVQGVELFP